MLDRYGPDVLSSPRTTRPAAAPMVSAEIGLVVECATTGFCGAVLGVEKTVEGTAVRLEDRHGRSRSYLMDPGAFLLDGRRVTLVRPQGPPLPGHRDRSASGSVYVANASPQVAQASRIWVEGIHDADVIERVWGHDLRVEGIVVEPLHGADHLTEALRLFAPGPQRRVGVLLDHLVPWSKESALADEVRRRFAPHVIVVGHPFVDVWQAVKPERLGLANWPSIPPGQPWKAGIIAALGWRTDEREAWGKILASVRGYADLEPELLGRVEELIDFVTHASRVREA